MSYLAAAVGMAAMLVQIAAYVFVFSALLFASSLLVGGVANRWFRWLDARRLRVDMGPNKSRGWTP